MSDHPAWVVGCAFGSGWVVVVATAVVAVAVVSMVVVNSAAVLCSKVTPAPADVYVPAAKSCHPKVTAPAAKVQPLADTAKPLAELANIPKG